MTKVEYVFEKVDPEEETLSKSMAEGLAAYAKAFQKIEEKEGKPPFANKGEK